MIASAGAVGAQLTTQNRQVLPQSAVGNLVEAGDHFGRSLAAGDFDGDDCDDLAIGVPDEGVGAIAGAGDVVVVYGNPAGLGNGSRPEQGLHKAVAGVPDDPQPFDGYGTSVASGDFDGNGFDDLIIGIPFDEGEAGPDDIGGFQVFYGGMDGIDPSNGEFATVGLHGGGALAGWSVAAGRLDPLYDGVVIGAPGGDSVLLVPGSSSGLDDLNFETVTAPAPLAGSAFGWAVAVAQLDGVGDDEVVVAAPVFGGDHGYAAVFDDELVFAGRELIGEEGELLGWALAAGDFNGAGDERPLIGAPGFGSGATAGTGRVWLYDWQTDSSQQLRQGTAGFLGAEEADDGLGRVLAVGDFDADGYQDAVFGVPLENLSAVDAGVVHVVHGGPSALLSSPLRQLWSIADFDVAQQASQEFGAALAAGDFDCNGSDDLAIGAPGAAWDGKAETGLVLVLYSSVGIFADSFESGNLGAWSAAVP